MCEMPTVYECDRPKARKEHTCCECRGKISIGETYHKHHGIWDGEADTYKVCDDCEIVRDIVDKDQHPDDKSAFGHLYESVMESHQLAIIKQWLDIRRKRGAKIEPWMLQREAELSNDKISEVAGRKET